MEFHAQLVKRAAVVTVRHYFRAWPLVLFLCFAALGATVYAQIEGSDRGVLPVDGAGGLEVSGITVDVFGKTADVARYGGWREAQRKGWRLLWAKYHGGGGGAPGLSDGQLDSIVSAIVIEDEQIGPTRYIGRLGILFDRVRAAEILGIGGQAVRSAPMLVVPVEWQGGTPLSFEQRTEWQKATYPSARVIQGSSGSKCGGLGRPVKSRSASQQRSPMRSWCSS